MLARVVLFLSVLAVRTTAQTEICYWSQIRGGVIRDAIYLDGGQKTLTGPTGQFADVGNGSMYTLNFSSSFDVSKDNLTLLFRAIAEGSSADQVQGYHDGFMFADAYELYTYGGLPNDNVINYPPAQYLYGYKTYEKDPTVQTPVLGSDPSSLTLPDNISRYITNGAGVSVPSEVMGFYFAGYQNGSDQYDLMTQPVPADSLITVNMASEGQPTWTNDSLSDNNVNVVTRANAGLVWIPVGTKGTLIAIGGVSYPEDLFNHALDSSQISYNENTDPGFMQKLPVYDVANSAWWVQSVTGTTYPPPLSQFCSVMVSAKGSSSYEIYVYGGYDGTAGQSTPKAPSDDVWVLSVPSFTWTKVHNGNSTLGRYGHICTAPYPDQMFVIGGMADQENCLAGTVIQVFNLNKLQWQTVYDPSVWAEYTIPSVVASAIKSNPTATWSQPQISTLFNTPYTGSITTYYPYASIPPHHSNIAAIAGGAAAGGVCLIVLVLAIFWYRRKHKKSPHEGDAEVQPYEQVSRWRRGVPKTDPSVTTTEVEDNSVVNPETGGYYKTAEVPGDERFPHHTPTSPRPGVFAEAGGGTRRISGGQIISPRSPRSPNSGNLGAQEADGEERYEMEVLQSERGSGDMGARQLFRNHPLYPLSVSDGDGRSQASGPSYSGPSHSHSQASRGEASRHVPSPYLMARPDSGITEDTELPASPVRPNHFQHTRNISSISAAFPPVSPPLEQHATNPMATPPHTSITSEDELDALEAFHTGTPQPFRPSHKRNPSSMSSGINQLPTPSGELTEEEKHRQSTLLAKLPSPLDGTTPVREERNPLLGGGNGGTARGGAAAVGEDVYSPSSYSRGSTLVSPSGRSPVSRKPVGQGSGSGQGLGIERVFSSREGLGEDRQTL